MRRIEIIVMSLGAFLLIQPGSVTHATTTPSDLHQCKDLPSAQFFADGAGSLIPAEQGKGATGSHSASRLNFATGEDSVSALGRNLTRSETNTDSTSLCEMNRHIPAFCKHRLAVIVLDSGGLGFPLPSPSEVLKENTLRIPALVHYAQSEPIGRESFWRRLFSGPPEDPAIERRMRNTLEEPTALQSLFVGAGYQAARFASASRLYW